MLSRRFLLLGASLLLSGCVSIPPHALTVQDVRSLRVVSVEGVVAPDAKVIWPAVLQPLVEARMGPEHKPKLDTIPSAAGDAGPLPPPPAPLPVVPTAEKVAAVERELTAKLRQEVEPLLRQELAGTRPVRAVFRLHDLKIHSGVGRVLMVVLAGQSGDENTLVLSAQFIDAKTGAVVLELPRQGISGRGGYGVVNLGEGVLSSDPLVRMLTEFKTRLYNWLLKI